MDQQLYERVKLALAYLMLARPDNKALPLLLKKTILTSADILLIFGISYKTLYRWIKTKKLPVCRVTTWYIFHWEDILPYLEKART
jgi:hypothetical protein